MKSRLPDCAELPSLQDPKNKHDSELNRPPVAFSFTAAPDILVKNMAHALGNLT